MILLLNRSFYPDTEATGQLLTDLAESLSGRFRVTAVCGRSFRIDDGLRGLVASQRRNGVRIVRVAHTRLPKESPLGRIANWFSYSAMAALACLRERPRFLLVHTDPPLLGPLALFLKRLHRCDLVYSCQDLYPDVAVQLGVTGRGWLTRLFDRLNARAFREARVTIALGRDMARRIAAKGVDTRRIEVIPSWVDTARLTPVPPAENAYLRELNLRGRVVIMYSGNIGLTQDFATFLQAATRVKAPRSKWMLVFVGSGAALQVVRKRVESLGLDNALFLPPQPRERLSELLSAGTLHVVPMKPHLAGCVVPSKIYGIMAAGRPFLAICDPDCDMAELAREQACGLWARAGDIDAVRKRLDETISNPASLNRLGANGRKLARERFDVGKVLADWNRLFERLVNRCAESQES